MVTMKFTNRGVNGCQNQKTGYLWAIFQVAMVLLQQQSKSIQQLMVAPIAVLNAIPVNEG